MRPQTFLIAATWCALATAPSRLEAEAGDAAVSLLWRSSEFLHRVEVDGVSRETRKLGSFPEEIRLSVVPQVLGFGEIHRVFGSPIHRRDVQDRAEALLGFLPWASTGSLRDGMLATALLEAWETCGDPRYLQGCQPLIDRFLATPVNEARLNSGLMGAMALARYHRLTGHPGAAQQARAFILQVAREQHPDGSFPHFCPGTRDVHYSAWMAMELMLIRRDIGPDPILERVLERLRGFLAARVGLDGMARYEEVSGTGIHTYYYSLASGCAGDYDTRGWVNELGYLALLFDRTDAARARPLLQRLTGLEDRGAFPDKFAHFADPSDPIYVWAMESRSVIRTSVVFWTLATLVAERRQRDEPMVGAPSPEGEILVPASEVPAAHASGHEPPGDPGVALTPGRAWPNPARGATTIEYVAPPAGASAVVVDAAGRRVRDLGWLAGGRGRLEWDGLDSGGRRAPAGLYFVRLDGEGRSVTTRVLRLD